MKQHSKRDESNPLTNISVTNNVYKSTASTQRSEEENQIKDENNLKLNETKGGLKRKHDGTGEEYEALKKCLIKYKQEYEEKITLGENVYMILGEGEVPEDSLPKVIFALYSFVFSIKYFFKASYSSPVPSCLRFDPPLVSLSFKLFSSLISISSSLLCVEKVDL